MNRHQRRAAEARMKASAKLMKNAGFFEMPLIVSERNAENIPVAFKIVPPDYTAAVGDEVIIVLWDGKRLLAEEPKTEEPK